MVKYFQCPQCGATRGVTIHPGVASVIVYCNSTKCGKLPWKIHMQEIAQAGPRLSAQGATVNVKKPAGRHYDWLTYDDLFGGPFVASNAPPPKPKVYKCTSCGRDTTNGAAQLCDVCFADLMLRMRAVFQAQQRNAYASMFTSSSRMPWDDDERIDTWVYCTGCGDLMPEKSGMHQCPEGPNFVLRKVEFKYKMEDYMTPVTNVRVWWDPAIQAYRLASPYNKDFVEGLKKQIPYSDRSFDPDTKIWTFVERQLAPVQAFFKLLGVQATIITRAQAEQASQSTPAGPQRGAAIAEIALTFMRTAGPDAMLKAYRAAAMSLHPDRGGSMDQMSALNAAWDRIQKEVFKLS